MRGLNHEIRCCRRILDVLCVESLAVEAANLASLKGLRVDASRSPKNEAGRVTSRRLLRSGSTEPPPDEPN